MSGAFGSSQWAYSSGVEAVTQQSLKFNDDESQYLSWTPAAAGNRKTWTWSGWVKRGNLGADNYLLSVPDSTGHASFRFNSSTDTLEWSAFTAGYGVATTSATFRDVSAWYHIVLSYDTTNATSTDRIKIYVNGTLQSTSSYTAPTLNIDTPVSNTVTQYIGKRSNGTQYFDGYLSDVYFIDGQALDPTSFGQFTNGYWEKKDYAGSYGTNGFHLTFADDVVSEGFNTVTYTGNGGTQSISGLGFAPDFLWFKKRSGAESHHLGDTIRGASKRLVSNTTAAETTESGLVSFDSDGFTISGASGGSTNDSGATYVAWCWDAGSGSPVSNTDGTITSTVKANPDYGFSIVSWTGNGTAGATIGHGLSSAPELIINKNRIDNSGWGVYHSALGATKYIWLQEASAAATYSAAWNDTAPTSSVFTVGNDGQWNGSGDGMISYCFNSVAGYSKISSYTGSGASGNAVTGLGFKPAFLMVRRTDSVENWVIYDNTRSPAYYDDTLVPNSSAAENTVGADVTFDSDGFTLDNNFAITNASGGSYLYYAVADTREAAFWKDVSGQGNHWTPNNLDYRDSLPDSPANNWATLNVLTKGTSNLTLAEGNLKANAVASPSGSNWGTVFSSHTLPSTGKYYVEGLAFINAGVGNNSHLGILDTSSFQPAHSNITYAYTTGEGFDGVYVSLFNNYAQPVSDGVLGTAEGSLTDTTVLVMLAVDVENGKVWAGYNGTWLNSGDPNAGTGEIATRTFTTNDAIAVGVAYNGSNDQGMFANFGQDSTFAGAKPMGAYTDDNSIGNFQYAPPAGYLALCSANLPATTIIDGSDYFNTVLYTGNGTTNNITGVGFQPDFVWAKGRNAVRDHILLDVSRGTTKMLSSNLTAAEVTGTDFASFDADGFTLNAVDTTGGLNASGSTYAAWSWKAGGTAVSNTDGSITSQVSANVDAGFSITSYTGTGVDGDTVGHGLSSAPELAIIKGRTGVGYPWAVYGYPTNSAFPADGSFLYLNDTAAMTESTGSELSLGASTISFVDSGANINGSGQNYICYAFHSVEGFSKVGSYTGNGSADGPFVYTGFRPSLIIWKATATAHDWNMLDAARSPYNVVDKNFYPNSSNAEMTSTKCDFLSNGFKIRTSDNQSNTSGNKYIFIAFAEHPFKYANAR